MTKSTEPSPGASRVPGAAVHADAGSTSLQPRSHGSAPSLARFPSILLLRHR
jgi:hypothetical protein